jgi:hypothetical protein
MGDRDLNSRHIRRSGAGLDILRMVIKRYPCAYTASLGLQVTKWVSEGWQAAGLSCIHFATVRVNAYIPMALPVYRDSPTCNSSIGCFTHRHALYYDDRRQGYPHDNGSGCMEKAQPSHSDGQHMVCSQKKTPKNSFAVARSHRDHHSLCMATPQATAY